LRTQRARITLTRAPCVTLYHFGAVIWGHISTLMDYLVTHHAFFYSLVATAVTLLGIGFIPGQHQIYVRRVTDFIQFGGWWVGLGVLSSIGLGTGLHTFVLYLGPHIALVTMAAQTCGTLNFATIGPKAFVCPDDGTVNHSQVTFFNVLMKVQMACFLWGAGTAIGELPPYFVSRAAAISGQRLAELDEVTEPGAGALSRMDRVKALMFRALQRYGFWAIVVFASVPNPLFDLAGLTCGHFLVPFWTFFGATFIGKAVVKVHLQSCFVILLFNQSTLDALIAFIERLIPQLQGVVQAFLERQKTSFYIKGDYIEAQRPLLGRLWDVFLIVMVGWFAKSIVESTVQERLATLDQEAIDRFRADYSRTGFSTRADRKSKNE